MADVKVPKMLHKMSLATQKAWYKKQGMEMPSAKKPAEDEGKSAAAAKKVKVAPRKKIEMEPGSVRALNAARHQAYMAKGGRRPIGATGSSGHSVMAGSNMSTAKGIIAGIKAGFNPKVSLNPYQGEKEESKKKKVAESNGEYNKYGQPRPGSADVDPTSGDSPPKYEKRKPAQYKPQKEETEMNEVSKKEAEAMLGGPVKDKPKMPPGKQPAGYRYVRGLARRAMKAGLKEAKKPDASMVMTNQLRNKMITDKDKRTLGKVADLMAAQKKLDKKNMKEESEMQYIEEKLTAADPASKWISDFVKSDNPKFAGKSKKERIQQALGAYYAAKRGTNEEVEQIDEDHADTYKRHMSARISAAIRGDRVKEKKHAKNAEASAAKHFKATGKKIVDKGYTGGSPHIIGAGMTEEVEQVDEVTGYEGVKDRTDMIKRAAAMNRMGKGVFLSRVKARAAEMKKQKAMKEGAEGKTPETDTEVELAKKHGDPKKITYGDVVKARIEAAKKKAMSKDE